MYAYLVCSRRNNPCRNEPWKWTICFACSDWPRLRSALNLDIDPRLLEQADAQAKHEDVGLRVIVEKALALYLASDGLPPAIGASIAKTQADIALLAAQIEPIAAFLATIKYRDGTGARGRGIAIRGDDGEF